MTNQITLPTTLLFGMLWGLLSTAVSAESGLTGAVWYVQEFNRSAQECVGNNFRILFVDDTLAQCPMSCNTATVRYTALGASLTFVVKNSTIRYCAVSRDDEFMTALARVKRRAVSGHTIHLLADSDTLMTLTDIPRSPLYGVTWMCEQLNHSAENLTGYRLKVLNDTMVSVHLHCNTCWFRYRSNGDSIAFTPGMCTIVDCSGPIRENEFETTLPKVTQWKKTESRLLLIHDGDTLMRFVDSVTSTLFRHPWQLHSIQRISGTTLIDAPEKYTLTFLVDRTVRVHSDCNTCTGLYAQNNGISVLSINTLGCTNMGCGANSHDAAYTALLKTVAGSIIRSDTLMLYSLESVLRFIGPKTPVAMQRGERSRGMAPSGIAARRVGHTIVFESPVGGMVCVRVYNARGVCVGQTDHAGQRRVRVPIHGLGKGVYLATIMLNNGSGHGALRVIID